MSGGEILAVVLCVGYVLLVAILSTLTYGWKRYGEGWDAGREFERDLSRLRSGRSGAASRGG